ncbi:MAG: hypothetical protein ABIR38_10410 [Chthoniobacterales bacterium]
MKFDELSNRAIHQAQVLSCMRLAGLPIGLLINCIITKLTNGLKRFVL